MCVCVCGSGSSYHTQIYCSTMVAVHWFAEVRLTRQKSGTKEREWDKRGWLWYVCLLYSGILALAILSCFVCITFLECRVNNVVYYTYMVEWKKGEVFPLVCAVCICIAYHRRSGGKMERMAVSDQSHKRTVWTTFENKIYFNIWILLEPI